MTILQAQKLPYPRLIGIVGNPRAGKTLAQTILGELGGYLPVDDAAPLRQFTIAQLGMSHDDVYTQEGKAGHVEILGKTWQRRDILGTLGVHLEEMFGEFILPWLAIRDLDPAKRYCFGGVRKNQGHFYRQHGAIIIEIQNPLAPPSPYEFDRYNRAAIDYTITNDALANGKTREEERALIRDCLARIIGVERGL